MPGKPPEITPENFVRALATFIQGGGETRRSTSATKKRLIGKWQREPDEGGFYYKFNPDGSFETNEYEANTLEAKPGGVLTGSYTIGPENSILMEPHEKLRLLGLMFAQTGESLIIALKDGLTFEYKKVS